MPRVSHEPLFLNRVGQRKNLAKRERTFICVPVIINQQAVGSLGVDLPFKPTRDYERTTWLNQSGTLVILMGMANLASIATALQHSGVPPQMTMAVTMAGTHREEPDGTGHPGGYRRCRVRTVRPGSHRDRACCGMQAGVRTMG